MILKIAVGGAATGRSAEHEVEASPVAPLALMLVDLLIVGLIGSGAFLVMDSGSRQVETLLLLCLSLATLPLGKLIGGLYPGYGLARPERFARLVATLAVTVVALVGAWDLVLAPVGQLTGLVGVGRHRWVWAILSGAALALLLSDPLMRRLLIASSFWGQPVLIVGGGAAGAEVVRQLKLDPHLGLRPAAIIDDGSVFLEESEQGVPVMRSQELFAHANDWGWVDTAIVIENAVDRTMLLRLANNEFLRRMLLVPECHDVISLRASVRNLGGTFTIEVPTGPPPLVTRAVKRLFDISVSLAVLLLGSPVLLLIALAVRLDSHGPALFRQPRWHGGRETFMVVKFRTMHTDADKRLKRLLLANPALQREYDRFRKLDRDPRVTRVGRFLRKSSLDELPQLINVLKGEMSLIGPRPYTLDELSRLGPARAIMSLVKPGITGFWQVSGRNRRTFRERIAMDCYYARNASLMLDLWVLYRTVVTLVTADGK